MKYTLPIAANFLALSAAISLPPLIPSIPGVTEPLTSNAPPLPILQVPTPPLSSPPFTPSNIKPKKIGYFWTGAGDNQHKDFLATYSLDDDTFGTLIYVTDVPSSGNSPHHLGPSLDGKTLVGGGLLSLLKAQVSMTSYAFNNLGCGRANGGVCGIGYGFLFRHYQPLQTQVHQEQSCCAVCCCG